MSYFTEEALAEYTRLVAEKLDLEFTEGEIYDFARCMRADGSFYGTSGKCRKGSDAGDKEAEAPKTAGGQKRRATAGRARLLKEELEKVKDKMKGASPEEQNKILKEAFAAADRRSKEAAPAAPEGKKRASAGELREAQAKLFDVAKERRAAAKEAEKAYKAVDKETKGDNSPEAKKRRLEAGRAWDKAGTAADRAQTAWSKAHERWSKASEREKRAKMSPSQKAETRRIDKIIKEQG
jgi:hypothetical protein